MINIKLIAQHITLGVLDIEEFEKDCGLLNKRDIERKGTELLLKKLYEGREQELCYTPQGKPFFGNCSDRVSISHSHGRLAVLINQKESCGVDIELIREKVKNIKHKFLSEEEFIFAGDSADKLTTLWAAKEAIYKAYGLKEIDFIQHMKIESYSENQTDFFGYLEKGELQKKYLLRRENPENYALVYTLNEVR